VPNCPASEFSDKFVEGMRNRMAVSFHKYGAVKDAFPHKVDAVKSLKRYLDQYESTGNTEFLMDAANYAMIEFMLPSHARAHFRATDSAESPGRKWHAGGAATQKANK
jgi:hypothetical protein